ncbi:MAG: hypothetical protein KDA80_12360 [Planctomycetaceae bacterium]|nr:hypothetical protein [Planctomycetaceae bacterium]
MEQDRDSANRNQDSIATQNPPTQDVDTPPQPEQPQSNALNIPSDVSQTQSATGANAAPDMIGDFFGLGSISPTAFGPGFGNFGGQIIGGGGGNVILDPVNNTMFFVNGDTTSATAVNGSSIQFMRGDGSSLIPDSAGNIADLRAFDNGGSGPAISNPDQVFSATPTGETIATVTTPNGVVNNAVVYNVRQNLAAVDAPNQAASQFNIGTLKIAEGTSPIPRDRLIFNFSHFSNASVIPSGYDVSRFAPGFEKTFWDKTASFQVQMPFAATLTNDVAIDPNQNLIGGTEVVPGDLTMVVKKTLYQNCNSLISAGLQWTIPTSEDRSLSVINPLDLTDRRVFAVLNSESPHLLPFVGGVWNRDRWFFQGVMQFDFETVGNKLRVNSNPFGMNMDGSPTEAALIGRLQSQNYIFLDASVAYQIYRAKCQCGWGIASIAPLAELHYNRSLNSADGVTVLDNGINVATFGNAGSDFETLNAVVGTSIQMKSGGSWLIGYGTPIAGGSDREFDGELRVFYSYRFGGPRNGTPGNLRSGVF